jgi:hypothetical protein
MQSQRRMMRRAWHCRKHLLAGVLPKKGFMKYYSTLAIVTVGLGLLSIHPSAVSVRAQGSSVQELNSGQVTWKDLTFTAEKFWGSVATSIRLKTVPAGEVQKSLIGVPQQVALQASEPQIRTLTVQSAVDPPMGSNELISSQAWFASSNAAALQRIQLRQGDDVWQNIYRFTATGVYRLRKKPKSTDEKNLPPEQWTKVKESFYPFGNEKLRCTCVLEPSGLLYLAAAINFGQAATPLSVCVFNKQQLHLVTVTVGGYQPLQVNYLETINNHDIRTEAVIEGMKLSFQPRAVVSPDTEPEAFSFLGLRGDFDIFIDKASHLPVQVSGKILGFGNVQIKLQKVEF